MREKNPAEALREPTARAIDPAHSLRTRRLLGSVAMAALLIGALLGGASDLQAQEISLGRQEAGTTTAAEETPDDRVVLDIPQVDRSGAQDRNNPCGPYAITAAARYRGRDADFDEIARQVTPNTVIGIGPVEMMRALIRFDYHLTAKNDASFDEVVAAIRKGNPVILLVDTGENEPHWALVKGFEVDGDEPVNFYLEDTYFASRYRREHGESPDGAEIAADELMEHWDSPVFPDVVGGLVNWATGYKRYMIVCHVDNGGSSDIPLDSVSPASMFYVGITDFLKGARDHSVLGILRGFTEATIAGIAGFHHVIYSTVRAVGEMTSGFGEWLADVAGPAGLVLGLPFRGVGGLLEVVGGGLAGLTRKGLGLATRFLG